MKSTSKKGFITKRSSNKTKMMLASVVAVGAVTGVGMVVDTGNEAEAATITTHYWNKYDLTYKENYKETGKYGYEEDAIEECNKIKERDNVTDARIKSYADDSGSWWWYVIYFEISSTPSKGDLVGQVSSSIRNSYPDNGISGGYWYQFSNSETVTTNSPPSTPTLSIPSQQFKPGDKQIIGVNVSDPDGDALNITIQAAYDGSNTWETIYNGYSRTYNYTVPNNKTSVKFRAIASDGQASRTSAVSAEKIINSPSEIQSIITDKFNIVDDSTPIELSGSYFDREDNTVTAIVTANGQSSGNGSGADGSFNATASGTNLENGVHENPFSITLNDGIVDGTSVQTTTHIVVKVDDVNNYLDDFNGHLVGSDIDANTLTKLQHETFYNAYTAVQAYEAGRTQSEYETAHLTIAKLKNDIAVTESPTLDEWTERLAVVFANVALEKAESTLAKVDYEDAERLHDALSLQSNKDKVQVRIDTLAGYHVVSDLLVPMEQEVKRHQATPASDLDLTILYINGLLEIRDAIKTISNTSEANYKTDLTNRYNSVRAYYLNNKNTLTGDDLSSGGENVDPELKDVYDEFKDAFAPVDMNTQALIDYTNAVAKFIREVDATSKANYDAVVASLPTGTGIDFSKLATVTTVIDSIYTFRTTFREDENQLATMQSQIQGMKTGTGKIKDAFEQIRLTLKEVTEYNQVALDETHNDEEKAEAQIEIDKLWVSTKFQQDMQDYLDNGIPMVLIAENPYEYLHKDTLKVKGKITDTNHSSHTVKVTIGSTTFTQIVGSDGQFEVSFTLSEGLTTEDLVIAVNDGLTEKMVTILGKPIIHVNNVDLMTDLVKALETDLNISLGDMTSTTIEALLEIFTSMQSIDMHSSPILVRSLYNKAEVLSTKTEGKLETYVKSYLQMNYLKWLFDNHLTVTVDDFEFAGVVKNNQSIVTYENIADLRTLITDYKNSYVQPDVPPVPTVENYIQWVEMLTALDALSERILSAYEIVEASSLTTEISEIETAITKIPEWSSQFAVFTTKLTKLKAYQSALKAVIQAETTFKQEDKDAAVTLVEEVLIEDVKTKLLSRLNDVQAIIDVTILVEVAETSLEQVDIDNAQTAVTALKESAKKDELQDRLNKIGQYNAALEAVIQAETTYTQNDHDAASTLVNTLAESPMKTDLVNRLVEVQKVIDATNAVELAETTALDSDIVAAQSLIDELTSGTKQTELQNRLDNVKQYSIALLAVIQAETTYTQNDHDAANTLVSALVDGQMKTELVNRLAEVKKVIDAIIAVELAETTKALTDIEAAQTLVTALKAGDKKTELQDRINELLKYVEAEKAVTNAESTLKQTDKDAAKELVNQLQEGSDKDALLERLEQLQNAIDKKSVEEKATDAVEKAEGSWEQADKNEAEEIVKQLEDGTTKEDLINRLDELQKLIDLYENAKDAVEKAEGSKLKADVDEAQELIDQLPASEKTTALQNRLDEVNRYIVAEQAVVKAETSKYQRHLEQAQALVDQLKDGSDKEALQARLDALKLELDGKENDILDRIVNGNPPVTAEELADYTKETVYEELLDDYIDDMRDIADQNKNLTKEDVIEVIRVLNALELAKRQMTVATISAYQTELSNANISIKGKYPTPQVMFATAAYLEDDSKQADFAQELANLLNRDLTSVQAEIDALLAGTDITIGTYTIQYVDEEGTSISSEIREVEFGQVLISLEAPKGYALTDTTEFEFELNEETNGKIFDVTVKKVEEVSTGSYLIKYVDEEGNLIHQEVFENVEYGLITIAPLLEGYSVIEGTYEISFELNGETTGKEITVIVQLIPETGEPTEETIPPASEETTEPETNEVEHITADTIGEETAFVRSLLTASLSEVKLSFSPIATSAAVSHEQYLYQAAQALLMVKAYVINPTPTNLTAAQSFVVGNLYDGTYKKYLLSLLGTDIVDTGEDGEPDLTPVYPYEPPVKPITPTIPVAPPVTPNVPTEPITPPVVEKTPPVIDFEVPKEIENKGTEAVKEKVGEVEKTEDGSYKWIIENPLNTDFTLTADDMKIDISFDKEVIKNALKLEIQWKHLGNEHYQLLVYADGKEIQRFNAAIELSKEKDFAYMIRQVDGQYKAMPYNYTEGKFNFAVTHTGVFYFSKEKITFDDIAKYTEMKDAIEELASRYIVYGVAPSKYAPNGKVTRAQFAAMLTRALGLEASDNETPFKDTKGKWFEKEVQALYEAGIISGVTATKFNPNASLTREQAATMLNKVIELNGKQEGMFTTANDNSTNSFAKLPTFADANKISDYAKKAVATLEWLKIVHGKPDGSFDPKGTLTRSQMAKMLSGVLKYTGDM